MGQAVKPGATAVTVTPEPFVWKAVEAAIRPVEFNPTDHSMGYGGLLNILGAVELDASLMHRRSLEAGAVWAVHGHEHVRSLAREVMPRLPHVVLRVITVIDGTRSTKFEGAESASAFPVSVSRTL